MTKSKSTKKALLASAVSLILCFSMLLGTTYAWFTDSVTSANNKIQAGMLEVDLLMADADGNYESIADEDAAIFGADSLVAKNDISDTLWEPGKTQIAYLGVENKGSLDLKYNILLNVIDGGLVGSLEYAILDGVQSGNLSGTPDWDTLKAAANAQTGDVKAGSTVAAPNGAIQAAEGEERAIDYFALAIHMKEDADNRYQGKNITVDVTVAATQLASEEDSFGNQYDAAATFLNQDAEGNWLISSAADLIYFGATVNGGKTYQGETVLLTADIDMKGYSWIPVGSFGGTFDGNEKTISNLTITGETNVAFFRNLAFTAVIKNVTFDGAQVSGNHYVAVVLAYETNNNKNAQILGVTVKNSTVTAKTLNNDDGDKVGAIVGYATTVKIDGCTVENTTVKGYRDVGGIIGFASALTWEEYLTVTNNTVKDCTVICDPSVNYKNYTQADQFDIEPIVGEATATAVIDGNEAENVNVIAPEFVSTKEGLVSAIQSGSASMIVLTSGTYDLSANEALTVTRNGMILQGEENTVIRANDFALYIDANDVKLNGLTIEVAMSGAGATAPITTNNRDLTIENCNITRTTQAAQAYGCLVDVGNGVLTAKNTVFTAPYDPAKAYLDSPSVINAIGGVDLDGCTIATDGYGLFSQRATKGTVKNTTFTGVDGRPALGVFNSTLLDGLVFDGCTFEMGYNSTVAAGNFTIKNSTFDFTNTPADGASNAISIYSQNGPIELTGNTFKLAANVRGINLTSADSWAPGDHDAADLTITGNTFENVGLCAIRITGAWRNVAATPYPDNTFNGNTVVVE